MELGAFSISLAVKDIKVSKLFYEHLGFRQFAGDIDQYWLIMKNGNTIIGLFQGMFEKNIMTFNPGWDQDAKELNSFSTIRDIQKELLEKGIHVDKQISPDKKGPANFTITDPDGNTILIDQHVDK